MSELQDLARAHLDVYQATAGSEVAALRSKLDGDIGMALIANQLDTDEQAEANSILLHNFVSLLPQAEWISQYSDSWEFTVDKQSTAKFLQASTVWVANSRPSLSTGRPVYFPFYVMGKHFSEDGKQAAQLLMKAKEKGKTGSVDQPDVGVMTRHLGINALRMYEEFIQQQLGTPFSLSDHVYDSHTGKFNLTSTSPGSVSGRSNPPKPANPTLIQRFKKHKPERAPEYNRRIGQLSAQTLHEYDVFSDMFKLAARFDVVEQTDRLLSESPALALPARSSI